MVSICPAGFALARAGRARRLPRPARKSRWGVRAVSRPRPGRYSGEGPKIDMGGEVDAGRASRDRRRRGDGWPVAFRRLGFRHSHNRWREGRRRARKCALPQPLQDIGAGEADLVDSAIGGRCGVRPGALLRGSAWGRGRRRACRRGGRSGVRASRRVLDELADGQGVEELVGDDEDGGSSGRRRVRWPGRVVLSSRSACWALRAGLVSKSCRCSASMNPSALAATRRASCIRVPRPGPSSRRVKLFGSPSCCQRLTM